MKFTINNDSTQIIYEPKDQQIKSRFDKGEFRGETIICQPKGGCLLIRWPDKPEKESE